MGKIIPSKQAIKRIDLDKVWGYIKCWQVRNSTPKHFPLGKSVAQTKLFHKYWGNVFWIYFARLCLGLKSVAVTSKNRVSGLYNWAWNYSHPYTNDLVSMRVWRTKILKHKCTSISSNRLNSPFYKQGVVIVVLPPCFFSIWNRLEQHLRGSNFFPFKIQFSWKNCRKWI